MKNEYEDYMDQLRELHKLITNKDIQNAKKEIERLSNLTFNNPLLLTAFQIIQLEFFTMTKDYDTSRKLKDSVIKKRDI